jgi:hypothetical protein
MTEVGESISAEERRQALALALNSRTLSRAEQLKAFLRHVVEADLAGRSSELTEHLIGVEVFGRPVDYTPAEDSSVRTRAYELRQKLDRLYALEAREAPVQIVLPKGSYVPQYVRLAAAPNPAAEPTATAVVATPRKTPWVWLMAGAVVGVVAGALLTWLAVRTGPPSLAAVVAEAWAPFLNSSNVTLCTAMPLHLTVGPLSHRSYNSPTWPAPSEVYPVFRQNRPLHPDDKLGLVMTDNVLGVGTMNAVIATGNLLRQAGSSWQVLPERVSPLSSLRNRDAILFGAPVDSEAVSKVLEATPLSVVYDPAVNDFVIRNRRTGASLVPKKTPAGEYVEVYGLVTVLNNRETERGGRLGLMVFSGITSTGTQGAAEYFSSPRSLASLRSRLGNKGFPVAFQVAVRCSFSNKLLLSYSYDSHEVIQW